MFQLCQNINDNNGVDRKLLIGYGAVSPICDICESNNYEITCFLVYLFVMCAADAGAGHQRSDFVASHRKKAHIRNMLTIAAVFSCEHELKNI